jgi:hypothetical protein
MRLFLGLLVALVGCEQTPRPEVVLHHAPVLAISPRHLAFVGAFGGELSAQAAEADAARYAKVSPFKEEFAYAAILRLGIAGVQGQAAANCYALAGDAAVMGLNVDVFSYEIEAMARYRQTGSFDERIVDQLGIGRSDFTRRSGFNATINELMDLHAKKTRSMTGSAMERAARAGLVLK